MQDILTNITQAFKEYAPMIGGALIILLVGWIIALLLASIVRSILRKTNIHKTFVGWFNRETNETPPDIPVGAGKFVFWTVMVLSAIAAFQVLNLTIVTGPLSGFAEDIIGFLPQLIGAGILFLIAWIIAKIVKLLVTKILQKTTLDEKLASGSSEGNSTVSLSQSIGDILYWLVFLLFLPAILDTLSLDGLLEPVQTMFNQFMGYLPNIVGALLIGLVGWFVARIVQKIVTSLLSATGVDTVSEKYKMAPLSNIIGIVVYVLILVPVLIAALNALKLDAITTPASSMLATMMAALPNIFAAVIIIAIGFFIGRFVSGLVAKLLAGVGFDNLFQNSGIGAKLASSKKSLSDIAGQILFVAIMLFTAFEAFSMLGFDALSSIITELTVFGGHLLFGLVILLIGLYLGNLASTTVKNSNLNNASFYAQLVRAVILLLVGSMAIRQMGIANEIINMAFGLSLGAIAIAAAIAFGIGGREMAAKKLEEWNNKVSNSN